MMGAATQDVGTGEDGKFLPELDLPSQMLSGEGVHLEKVIVFC